MSNKKSTTINLPGVFGVGTQITNQYNQIETICTKPKKIGNNIFLTTHEQIDEDTCIIRKYQTRNNKAYLISQKNIDQFKNNLANQVIN